MPLFDSIVCVDAYKTITCESTSSGKVSPWEIEKIESVDHNRNDESRSNENILI